MTQNCKEQLGKQPFWKSKSLAEMSTEEWESLCDGCGQCCLMKLEDRESGDTVATDIACKLLDLHACRCGSYANRQRFVANCRQLTVDNLRELTWLPDTCAYRLIDEGKDLYPWHPLISGDPESVHEAGVSVRGKAFSEADIPSIQDVLADIYGVEID